MKKNQAKASSKSAGKKNQSPDSNHSTDIDAFFTDVDKEDDFARIVLGAAKVDACLAIILDSFLVDSSTKTGLLSHAGVIGSFAARAKLCYTLGLISKHAFSDMMIFAELRNETAHHPLKISFRDEHVKEKASRLTWLKTWLIRNYGNSEEISTFFDKQVHEKFNMTVALLCTELMAHAKSLEKRVQFEEPLSNFHLSLLNARNEPMNQLPPHIEARKKAAEAQRAADALREKGDTA
jgi:DNA-binding MltR family transcriptional regulator